jgi:hypothetical protein
MTNLIFLPLMLFVLSQSGEIKTSEQLIRAMHNRYASSWYKTLTFQQVTKQYPPSGTPTSAVWHEALLLPSRLRIEMDSTRQLGIIFAHDSQYVFRNGKLSGTRWSINPLLLLGFDLYHLPISEAVAKLKASKFDLSILREDSWQGRPVYVVGAKKGDSLSHQFWIDKERLTFVRLLEPGGRNGSQTLEAQFNKYARLAGGWISSEVVAKLDGKVVLTEEYSKIKAGVKLDPALFDPDRWTTARWR